MKSAPDFNLRTAGPHPFIEYTAPCPDSRFFIRLYLRGPGMSNARGDPERSRAALSRSVPLQGPLIAPRQVHGDRILEGRPEHSLPNRPEADGILLERCGVEGSLRFADCYPVILASTVPSPWIVILHSGFKGVLNDIAGSACRLLFSTHGRTPESTFAWIGPGIGWKQYERRRDDRWTEIGLRLFRPEHVDDGGGEILFDLGGQIASQLADSGIPRANIRRLPLCTFERNDLFYSYRRGDEESRLFLLAFLGR
ncbi:MAG: polyphenol oxidase family protein [Synergistaceae bacterium]|nr:polyphenol oxidase family protein [Synergistota bacterium]NLM71632.1 polyphenol oxidase family protein [Synergistaceae bacterium]